MRTFGGPCNKLPSYFEALPFQKRIRDLEYLEGMLNNDTANISLIDPNVPLTEQISLLPYYDKWEFPVEKLKLSTDQAYSMLRQKVHYLPQVAYSEQGTGHWSVWKSCESSGI